MSIVTGTTIQREPVSVRELRYAGGTCSSTCTRQTQSFVPCRPGDWAYEVIRDCTGFGCRVRGIGQFQCSSVEPTICPTIGEQKGQNPRFVRADVRDPPRTVMDTPVAIPNPEVICDYDLSNVASSLTNVEEWIRTYGENDSYQNAIMPTFCSARSDNCTPGTGNQVGSCSRFSDVGVSGELCRSWALNNPIRADSIKQSFCTQNPNSEDCQCLNRTRDSNYNQLRSAGLSAIPDRCWYIPCKPGIVGNITLSSEQDLSVCPTNICQQVNNFLANSGAQITIGDIQQSVDCQQITVQNPGTAQEIIDRAPSTPGANVPSPGGISIWVWVAIGVVVVIVIILLIWFFLSRRTTPAPTPTVVVV